jgi:hypothetical protein
MQTFDLVLSARGYSRARRCSACVHHGTTSDGEMSPVNCDAVVLAPSLGLCGYVLILVPAP